MNKSASYLTADIFARLGAKSERVYSNESIDTKMFIGFVATMIRSCIYTLLKDEAPMAYKSLEDIIDMIRESVDVIDVMKPIYNFKASD